MLDSNPARGKSQSQRDRKGAKQKKPEGGQRRHQVYIRTKTRRTRGDEHAATKYMTSVHKHKTGYMYV